MNEPLKFAFESMENETYQEGVFDCALFLARWADKVSGSSIEKELAGTYKNKIGGLRKFARRIGSPPYTFARLAVPFMNEAGWIERREDAKEGDLVEVKGWVLAIMTELGPVSFGNGSRLIIHKRADIIKSWEPPMERNSE